MAGSDQAQEEKLNEYGEPMLVLRRNNNFNLKPPDKTPEVEWWDEFFLPEQQQSNDNEGESVVKVTRFGSEIEDKDLHMGRITHFI